MNITKSRHNQRNHERGVASILTVIFFILIASIITIGFLRLSLNEGRQSLEDSLSKSALAAAYSGVNDAKRAILYCLQNKNEPECDEDEPGSIYNDQCPGFFINDTVTGELGLPKYSQLPDGSMPVGDDPTDTINERYTCVTITNDTYEVSGPLMLDQSDSNTAIVPLRSSDLFNGVRISWQRRPILGANLSNLTYGGAGNELRANYRHTGAYPLAGACAPTNFKWCPGWPALLKVSLFSHPNSGITFNADGTTNIVEKTAYLYPRNQVGPASISVGGLIPRQMTNCSGDGYAAAGDLYLCQLTINGLGVSNPDFDPMTHTMYLQVSNMYVDTDYRLELLGAGGAPVLFNDVSPEVDSTGAVGDIFRRVQVRLQYQTSTPLLSNALDTGSGICKNFIVGKEASIFREDCGY